MSVKLIPTQFVIFGFRLPAFPAAILIAAIVISEAVALGSLSLFSGIYLSPASAAECNGDDIDGELLSATAYSHSTGNYYRVQVEFSGDDVTVYFRNGGYRRLTLDDEDIDDPTSISAYDYDRATHWDIDIGDCP